MRVFLVGLMAGATMATAADLTVKSGKTYRSYELLETDYDGVKIMHDSGACTLAFDELPPELQIKYMKIQLAKAKKAAAQPVAKIPEKLTAAGGGDKTSVVAGNSPDTTGTGRTIYTGPRGGRYYLNGNGKKVYLKKRK